MDTYSLTTVLLDLLSCQRGTENSEVKCQILGEYINNPFLDDDVNSLSLRTGLSRDVLAPILSTLREEGFLKSAGHRGHMLALTDYKHSNQINVKDKGLEPVFFEKIGDKNTSRDEMRENLIKALKKNGWTLKK